MQKTLLVFTLFFSHITFAQLHLGVFAGGANYIGELNDKPYKGTHPALGVSLNYELSDRVMVRTGVTFGKVEGNDQWSGSADRINNRNLRFKSNIFEGSLVGELTAFNLYNIKWSPYAFAGVALFHYYPFTDTTGDSKVPLRRLRTEGEGIDPGYPPQYSMIDLSLPFGGGIKYNISDDIRIGLEIGLRKTFTDYLDDVSGYYADPTDLLSATGPTAVALSYRGNGTYPVKGTERGNPETQDWYYFTGLHLTFRLGSGYGRTFASGGKRNYGCPTNF